MSPEGQSIQPLAETLMAAYGMPAQADIMARQVPDSKLEDARSNAQPTAGGRSGRAARRNEALKAKNRRAQARYRERQKDKFSEYKAAVDELSQQLESLSAEKDALAADKAMLQSCLQVSYQKGLAASPESSDAVAASAEAYQHAIWKTARVDGPLLEAMLGVFNKARAACDQPPLSRQDVENTSLCQVFERKEMCVRGTAALLKRVDREGTQAAFQDLVDYMQEQAAMFNLLYTQHGQLARVMEASHVQTSRARHGVPTPRFWAQVADSLALTEQQKARMLQLRRQLLARMDDVRQRRAEVLESLQGDLPSNINSDVSGTSFASTFIQGTHSAELLRQSLHEEHRTTHDFAGSIRRQVLSPYQHGVLEVKSFPYKVDLLAVCNTLAQQPLPQGPIPLPPLSLAPPQREAEAQLLGLHESPSGLVQLEQFTAELSQLHSGSLGAQSSLGGRSSRLPSSSDAGSQPWMAPPSPSGSPPPPPHLPPAPSTGGEGSGGQLESPRTSLQLPGSDMDALLLDI